MKAKVNDKIIEFPNKWSKDKIVEFCNQDFKICPYCGKVDIRLEHLSICTSTHNLEEIKSEQHYK